MKNYLPFVAAMPILAWLACNPSSSGEKNNEMPGPSPVSAAILPKVPDTTLPSGRRNIYLLRSRDQQGLFVERTEFPKGYIGMPHVHNEPLYVTILSGSANLIFGEHLDTLVSHQAYGPGSFVVIPADQAHYEWFSQPCTMQITGVGPVSTFYVNAPGNP